MMEGGKEEKREKGSLTLVPASFRETVDNALGGGGVESFGCYLYRYLGYFRVRQGGLCDALRDSSQYGLTHSDLSGTPWLFQSAA